MRGFTLPELLIASSVTAILLLAVYAIFLRTVEVQAVASMGREQRDAAAAIADELAHALERVVFVKELPAIEGPTQVGEQGTALTCTLMEEHGRGVERRRYRWGLPGERAGVLEVQRLILSGDTVLTPLPDDDVATDQAWQYVPPQVIGRGIGAIDVTLTPARGGQADPWTAGQGPLLVQVRVTVGGQVAQRTVIAHTDGEVILPEG